MEPQINTNPSPEPAVPASHGIGALAGTLIVLAVLVLGGVYFLTNNQRAGESSLPPPVILGDINETGTVPTSNSDAVIDIDADVEATDLANLESEIDADLNAIESSI